MPARSRDSSTRIIVGGWWPASLMHLEQVELFARQGAIAGVTEATAKHLHQNLNVVHTQRLPAIIPSLLITTEDGVEVWYSADGLYLCSVLDSSIRHGREQLQAFVEQQWIPCLTALFQQERPLLLGQSWLPEQRTMVQLTVKNPTAFEPASVFGSSHSWLNSKDLSVVSTADYVFIASTEQSMEDGWWICQWLVFTEYFQSEQQQSLPLYRQFWHDSQWLSRRQKLPTVKLLKLQSKLASQQSQVAWQLYRIDQLTAYLDQRLASVTEISVSADLIQPPSLWTATARQAQHYLMANWQAAEQQLHIRQQTLTSAIGQSYNHNIGLLRALVSMLLSGAALLWLHNSLMPDIALKWYVGLGAIVVVGIIIHIITSMLFQQRAFTLAEQRTTTQHPNNVQD